MLQVVQVQVSTLPLTSHRPLNDKCWLCCEHDTSLYVRTALSEAHLNPRMITFECPNQDTGILVKF